MSPALWYPLDVVAEEARRRCRWQRGQPYPHEVVAHEVRIARKRK